MALLACQVEYLLLLQLVLDDIHYFDADLGELEVGPSHGVVEFVVRLLLVFVVVQTLVVREVLLNLAVLFRLARDRGLRVISLSPHVVLLTLVGARLVCKSLEVWLSV